VRHEQGRYREARRWALRAEEHARAVNDAAALAEAYAVLHGVAAWTGLGKGESYGERALELFTSLGYRLQRAHALNNLASAAFFEGRWLDATAMFEEAFAEYRTVGAVYSAAVAQFNVADVLWRQNRFAEAEETLQQVRRVARGLKEPELLALAERELGRTLVLSGRPDEGLELLQAARDAFLAQGARYEELVTESALAEYLLSVGEPARALEQAESARARAEAAGASTLRATFSRLQAEALLAQGDASAAAEELTTTLSSLAEEEEYERGFLLLDLTRAHDVLGRPDVIDLRDQAHAELSRLGVVAQDTAIVTDP
jgi:tetratricopeptide (TPR) repeat protein